MVGLKAIVPLWGVSVSAKSLSSVVFPLPFLPITQILSMGLTVMLRSLMRGVCGSYEKERLLTYMAYFA